MEVCIRTCINHGELYFKYLIKITAMVELPIHLLSMKIYIDNLHCQCE